MRIAAVSFVASFVFVGLATLPAFACSYIANPDPPIEYIVGRTETVFFGTLIQKRVRTVKEDGETYRVHSLLFRVDESFKGKKDSRQTIEFWEKAKNLSSCDVSAPESKVGQQWVVFIGYDEGSDMLRYVRHSQFLSWHYEPDNKYDPPRLDKTRAAALKPKSTFYGQVERAMLDAPQAGVILNIELRSEDGSQLIKSTTQTFDSFQFDDVPRGTYTVRIHSSAKVQKYLYPIEKPTSALENAQTRFADFRITMDGSRPQFENFVIDWD